MGVCVCMVLRADQTPGHATDRPQTDHFTRDNGFQDDRVLGTG